MTIIDVALHKWRMLDDRRRRIVIGLIIFALLINVFVFYKAATRDDDDPKPDPKPNTTTTTTTSTTTSTTSTTSTTTPGSRPPSQLVASEDGLALAELDGWLVIGEDSNNDNLDLRGISALGVEPDGKPEEKRFKVNLKLATDELQISCKFIRNEKTIEADQVELSWNSNGQKKQCSLMRQSENANFFHSEPGKHYKCSKKITYDCTDGTSEVAHLIVDNLELEFNRDKPVDSADLKFETPSFECPT